MAAVSQILQTRSKICCENQKQFIISQKCPAFRKMDPLGENLVFRALRKVQTIAQSDINRHENSNRVTNIIACKLSKGKIQVKTY
jgi:hypothetical protein